MDFPWLLIKWSLTVVDVFLTQDYFGYWHSYTYELGVSLNLAGVQGTELHSRSQPRLDTSTPW